MLDNHLFIYHFVILNIKQNNLKDKWKALFKSLLQHHINQATLEFFEHVFEVAVSISAVVNKKA